MPARYMNLPIDYDTLQRIGSIMGSGGMVVMDENNCMVEIARYFLSFTQEESCGKCAPCRLGTSQLLEILTRITKGEGGIEDLETLKELGETIIKSSLCGLGQTAAKQALSTLNSFLCWILWNSTERWIRLFISSTRSTLLCTSSFLLAICSQIPPGSHSDPLVKKAIWFDVGDQAGSDTSPILVFVSVKMRGFFSSMPIT